MKRIFKNKFFLISISVFLIALIYHLDTVRDFVETKIYEMQRNSKIKTFPSTLTDVIQDYNLEIENRNELERKNQEKNPHVEYTRELFDQNMRAVGAGNYHMVKRPNYNRPNYIPTLPDQIDNRYDEMKNKRPFNLWKYENAAKEILRIEYPDNEHKVIKERFEKKEPFDSEILLFLIAVESFDLLSRDISQNDLDNYFNRENYHKRISIQQALDMKKHYDDFFSYSTEDSFVVKFKIAQKYNISPSILLFNEKFYFYLHGKVFGHSNPMPYF